ncbi:MAG: hypothetical protein QMD09_15015, partial [Desulfatibacillaceae bacterium]|nr:hypothetical protein [Desulfatibacillaceae bacterium]
MNLAVLVYVALAICILGLVIKKLSLFLRDMGIYASGEPKARRIIAGITGSWGVLFSKKIFRALWVFIADVLLQL